jgi:C-terminal peptidase prc
MGPVRTLVVATFLLAGLVRPGAAQPTSCTPRGQTQFVDESMRDVYYWYREMPNVDPSTFPSPEAYLDAVIYKPLDRGFTFIVPKAVNDAFYTNSEGVGIGFTSKALASDDVRIAQVYAGSPAAEAGLKRGDRILEFNHRTIADLVATGDIAVASGPDQAGVKVHLKLRGLDGAERDVEVVKRVVTIPTVPYVQVINVDRRTRVGYIHLKNFVEPTIEALDDAFTELERAAVTDLVLDVRYNGGGLLNVAQHLAGLIGGARTRRGVLCKLTYNDKHRDRDVSFTIPAPPHALTLPRLVVITSRASASASELIVNGLRPYIPVTTIGSRTYGKPAGQVPISFCDQVLFPATFVLKNIDGYGDYFDGLPADCPASDDLAHELADPAEASLAEALYFLKNGRCRDQARVSSSARSIEPPRAVGWRSVINSE